MSFKCKISNINDLLEHMKELNEYRAYYLMSSDAERLVELIEMEKNKKY